MDINNVEQAERYGRMSAVAINFHVATGNPAELRAAVCYARAAAYWAQREIAGATWNPPPSTCMENGQRLSFQVRVF